MRDQLQPGLFRPKLYYPPEPYDRLLGRTVERFPERTAVLYKGQQITYRELNGLVNAFCHALLDLGVARGERVALFMANRPEYLVAWYACARIGAVATLMNPVYREQEAAYQLNNSGAAVLVVGEAQLAVGLAARAQAPRVRHVIVAGREHPPDTLRMADLLGQHPADPPPPAGVDPAKDLLALPYSSGTTGLPKGVMLTHRNLYANNIQFVSALKMDHTSVSLIYLPFYHIYGCMLMGGTVAAGGTQVIMERFEPNECLASVERYGVTHWFAVPPIVLLFSSFAGVRQYNLSTVKFVMTGAAPLPPEVGRRFMEHTGVRVVQGYGLTEASPLTHINPVEYPELCRLDSVGFQVPDQEQGIVDIETGERVLDRGEIGELRVRGPHVMTGYWQAPEATAATLRDGWLHTGDIGYIDADGHVFITDRKKEMIKYKGFGVAPAEVEAVLHEHPAVADAAVIAKSDPEAGEIPKAFVVLRPGAAADAADLMRFVAAKVAGYKQVREVEFVDAIPRNPSGKILRRVLKERELRSN